MQNESGGGLFKEKGKMSKKLAKIDGYALLVGKVREELADLELFLKFQTVKTYWCVGKHICDHFLENKSRAGYGEHLYERLAQDTDRHKTIFSRAARLYRAYPIIAPGQQLTWSHYRSLVSISGDLKRKQIERLTIKNDWDSKELAEYIKSLRRKKKSLKEPKIIEQLSVTRGRLNIYKIIESEKFPQQKLLIDCGFQLRKEFSQTKNLCLKQGDCVKTDKAGIQKIDISKDELFTYVAFVEKIIDGDTIWALIDCGFGFFIRQKLRFRGINCSELPSSEGERAKRFVQNKLRNCKFIVIKTYKDTADKYDRYLTDIFYLPNETSASVVVREGRFLSQELLDRGLAVPM